MRLHLLGHATPRGPLYARDDHGSLWAGRPGPRHASILPPVDPATLTWERVLTNRAPAPITLAIDGDITIDEREDYP